MNDKQAELRRDYVDACRRRDRASKGLMGLGVPEYELALHLPYEDWSRFADLTCGAKTRAGTPCKQRGLFKSGRCRLHGGLSTGPLSLEGKLISASNGYLPKRTP